MRSFIETHKINFLIRYIPPPPQVQRIYQTSCKNFSPRCCQTFFKKYSSDFFFFYSKIMRKFTKHFDNGTFLFIFSYFLLFIIKICEQRIINEHMIKKSYFKKLLFYTITKSALLESLIKQLLKFY